VRGVFCNGLALWVDPDDVSGRLGKGAIFPIYKKISESKATISSLDNSSVTQNHHRPQQRPRSISPPQAHDSYPDQVNPSRPITVSTRPSKTPPGFRTLDAGQNFYNMQSASQSQTIAGQRPDFTNNDIQKLWRNPTSRTTGTMSQMNTRHQTSYVQSNSSSSKYNNNTNNDSSDDAVYSFNQYSSYYNPHFHWRKDQTTHTPSQSENANNKSYMPLKSLWQDEESYQRTHWFADGGSTKSNNTNKLSVAGNALTISKVQNYGYNISRQAQEVY